MRTRLSAFRRYSLLLELKLLRSRSLITEEQYQTISRKMKDRYFWNAFSDKTSEIEIQREKKEIQQNRLYWNPRTTEFLPILRRADVSLHDYTHELLEISGF